MLCPACGREQVRAPECRSCGVVFARYFRGRRLTSARRSLVRMPASRAARPWLLAGLAVALLFMAWTLRPSDDGSSLGGHVPAVIAEAAAETGDESPTFAPGLTADQLTWGLSVDSWQAPGYEPPPAQMEETEVPAQALPAASPTEPLTPGGESPIRHEPAEAPDAPSTGETASSEADAGGSRNDRYDPVGSRGWYEGIDGYEQALDERDRNDRTMVVYFHASWCNWCARFKAEYLTHRDMKGFLDDVIRVHIDPEQGVAEADLATMYGVRAFPSFFVVPAGTERPERLHPFLGDVEMSPERFARLCRHVSRGLYYDEPAVLGGDGVVPFTFDG